MNEDEARIAFRALQAEQAETRRAIETATKRLQSLEKLLEGYVELFPGLDEDSQRPSSFAATGNGVPDDAASATRAPQGEKVKRIPAWS